MPTDYRPTVFLPKTSFPMRGDLPKREPPILARWEEMNRIVHDIVAARNGSISAEHGIGRMKVEELTHYKTKTELDLMRKIKAALDPDGIMNPGKVVV